MIELFDEELNMPDRKSSKGNQLKFQRNGIWYKADYLGYEGLAEYTISKLLKYSNLGDEEYVDYDLEKLTYNGQVYNGCKSTDFAGKWQLITLERLFLQLYGRGLNSIVYSVSDHTERLKVMVDQVVRATGIEDFGRYMGKVLAVDAIFLNEDRHTHNIAVMSDYNGNYKLSPIFDNGAGLLSDTRLEYPLGQDYMSLMGKVKPKTFCDSFSEQLEIAEKLYGHTIKFKYGYSEVCNIVNEADQYSEEIRKRAIDVIMETRRMYSYMF